VTSQGATPSQDASIGRDRPRAYVAGTHHDWSMLPVGQHL
jgi:hypothetical protein